MPQLVLQFEGRVLKECSVGLMLTIGRLPDNTVVIDNPAVSSHHAAVFRGTRGHLARDTKRSSHCHRRRHECPGELRGIGGAGTLSD